MNLNQMREILKHYFQGECQVNQGASGMNNLTRFIEHEGKNMCYEFIKIIMMRDS